MSREQYLQVVSNTSLGNQANIDKKLALKDSQHYEKVRTHLLNLLQTTLEISELADLFFGVIREQLDITHLSYEFKPQNIALTYGQRALHTSSYSISSNGQELGELTLSRRNIMSERELLILEFLIGPLVLPLRNCLMYHQAIISAHTDPLTGLGSRSAMSNTLDREFSIAKRLQWPLSLLVIDIDWFKRINDTYGHSTGDMVLRQVADTVRSCLRNTDQCFRYGGEEFVVILSKTDAQQAAEISERIRHSVDNLLLAKGSETIKTSVSIGFAEAQTGDHSQSLFDKADSALYQAKANGRNQIAAAPQK